MQTAWWRTVVTGAGRRIELRTVRRAVAPCGAWSPDGGRLALIRGLQIWISDADGLPPHEVKDASAGNYRVTWLPDGRLAWQTSDARNYRIRYLASGREELLVKNPEVGWIFDPHGVFVDAGGVRGNRTAAGVGRQLRHNVVSCIAAEA